MLASFSGFPLLIALGLVGPVFAVWCLYLIPNLMLGLGVDPSYGQVINGLVVVLVVMAGGLLRNIRKAT